MRPSIIALAFTLSMVGCQVTATDAHDAASHEAATCRVGLFGTPDSFVAITRRGDTFRYSLSDGRWGKIDEGSEVSCHPQGVSIDQSEIWPERAIEVTDTQFEVDGALLAGQLLQPKGADQSTPLVVLAHGSEELGWIEAAAYPYQLVGRGVSVFVYDKRGTGRSSGTYSQNFPELSEDLVAAAAQAKTLADGKYGRFGLLGFSQGGWIVPMAAQRAEAEFIGIGYGLLVDILEEDASQVELELREAGYDDAIIRKAKQLTDVTARLAVSGYQDGLEDLDNLRAEYADEPWFSVIRGGFSGVILGMSTDELREKGIPMFDRLNIDWTVKPMPVLREVEVPQLWVLAENDREAPVEKTLSRLKQLRTEGQDITILMFPDTDHGMWEYEQLPDGSRKTTRVTDQYYRLLADWAKDDLNGPYASSISK